jgi:hypothetical protein
MTITGRGNPDGIEFVIESSALDLSVSGYAVLYGHGLIQMDAAIILALLTPTPLPTALQPSLTATRALIFPPGPGIVTMTPSAPMPITETKDVEAGEVESLPATMPSQESISLATSTIELEGVDQNHFTLSSNSIMQLVSCLWLILILLFFLPSRREKDTD